MSSKIPDYHYNIDTTATIYQHRLFFLTDKLGKQPLSSMCLPSSKH